MSGRIREGPVLQNRSALTGYNRWSDHWRTPRNLRVDEHQIRVMSFNVRGSFHDARKKNAWRNRAALNVATIERYAPDVIGLQEAQRGNLSAYRKRLPRYTHIRDPRYGNSIPHDFNTILFDPERLKPLELGDEGRAVSHLGAVRSAWDRSVFPPPEHAPGPRKRPGAPGGQQARREDDCGDRRPHRRRCAVHHYGRLQQPA